VMWRPGKLRFLIGVKNPLAIDRRRPPENTAPCGAPPVARFATPVGLRPPFVAHPATLPHPDRRALLILFAAQQDRSGCSRRASQRRLRGRFPRLLLRLPAKTEPAYGSFGAAYGADEPARELGARCRPSQLFRFGRPRMAAADGGA